MYKASRRYGLQGTDAMVFEALVWLSRQTKDGSVKISYSKLAEFSLCGGKTTCFDAIKRLIKQGIVFEIRTGVFEIRTEPSEIRTISKEERTKEENINKKEVCLKSDTPHTTFFDFWKIFSPNNEWKSYEKACKKIWDTLPADWKNLAAQRAGEYLDRNPLYYLQDEDFLRLQAPGGAKVAAPTWLTGEQQDECLRGGIAVVVCRNPKTGMFGAVTKEDAERFSLTIIRQM